MIQEGKLTTNGWLFAVFLVLALTTTFNPLINNRYFTLPWYIIMAAYGLWLLYRVVNEEEGT